MQNYDLWSNSKDSELAAKFIFVVNNFKYLVNTKDTNKKEECKQDAVSIKETRTVNIECNKELDGLQIISTENVNVIDIKTEKLRTPIILINLLNHLVTENKKAEAVKVINSENKISSSLAERIFNTRIANQISSADLAKAIGHSKSTIARIENKDKPVAGMLIDKKGQPTALAKVLKYFQIDTGFKDDTNTDSRKVRSMVSKTILLRCTWCAKPFERKLREHQQRARRKIKTFFCSRECSNLRNKYLSNSNE